MNRKGFDWRLKRRLPYHAESCNWSTMRRCNLPRLPGMARWMRKRGTQRFVARNASKSCLRYPAESHVRAFDP